VALIGFAIRHQFSNTVGELLRQGVPVTGLYAVYLPEDEREESFLPHRRYLVSPPQYFRPGA
jgi:hypothetical protein